MKYLGSIYLPLELGHAICMTFWQGLQEWIAAKCWQWRYIAEFLVILSMNGRSERQAFMWTYVDLHSHNAHIAT